MSFQVSVYAGGAVVNITPTSPWGGPNNLPATLATLGWQSESGLFLGLTGTSANRPTPAALAPWVIDRPSQPSFDGPAQGPPGVAPHIGLKFQDTTLGHTVVFDGFGKYFDPCIVPALGSQGQTRSRFMAPSNAPLLSSNFPTEVNAPGYQASAGNFADINDASFVNAINSGWILIGGVGPTSGRAAWLAGLGANTWLGINGNPTEPPLANIPQPFQVQSTPVAPPLWYIDTTLQKCIFYDSTTSAWRDPISGNSV